MAPRRKGKKLRITSPYLPSNVRPRIRVVQALDIDQWIKADKSGFLIKNGKRWASKQAICSAFRISGPTVVTHLSNRCEKIEGRDFTGRPREFYLFDQAKRLMKKYWQPDLQADKRNVLIYEGVRYGSYPAIAKSLGLSVAVVYRAIKAKKCKCLLARDRMGRIDTPFYSFSEVTNACKRLLGGLYKTDKAGKVSIRGRVYYNLEGLGRLLKVDRSGISSRIKMLRPEHAKDMCGRPVDVYCLTEVKGLCKDLLDKKKLPVANKKHFVVQSGVKYGSAWAFTVLWGLHQQSVERRLYYSTYPFIIARSSNHQVNKYYRVADAKKACADLLRQKKEKLKKDK